MNSYDAVIRVLGQGSYGKNPPGAATGGAPPPARHRLACAAPDGLLWGGHRHPPVVPLPHAGCAWLLTGKALLVRRKSDKGLFCLKQVTLQPGQSSADAMKEVRLLASLRHPNIVGFVESFVENSMLCIVTEFCDGGDLSTLLAAQRGVALSEARVLNIFVQVGLADSGARHC